MNESNLARPAQKPNVIKKSQVGGSKLDQQNLHTIMQAFRGCWKHCTECQPAETEGDKIQPIKCFYGCCFTTTESKAMEKHYKKEHRFQAKEVIHG